MANSISLINRLSPSVLKLGAKVVGNSASKSHPIKSGTFLLDGSPVTVKSGDDLKKIAKKISNSSRHITAKVKEHKGKFRLVIETTKSKMRFVDPDGVLKKLNSDGLIGTKNDSFVQIKGSHGQSVQVIFDNYRLPNRASGLTVALQEILAKTKSGNTLPYVHKAYLKAANVNDNAHMAQIKKDLQNAMNILNQATQNMPPVPVAQPKQDNDLANALADLDALNNFVPQPQVPIVNNVPVNNKPIKHNIHNNAPQIQPAGGWWNMLVNAKNAVVNAVYVNLVVSPDWSDWEDTFIGL